MTAEQAFLQVIGENPADDTPRLIFADWLEEHGQPERAEFIRIQCQLARHEAAVRTRGQGFPAQAMHPDFVLFSRREALRRRERELLATPAGTRFRPDALYGFPCEIAFRRGFIASISLPSALFMEHAANIIEAVPMLEEVRLADTLPPEILKIASTSNNTTGKIVYFVKADDPEVQRYVVCITPMNVNTEA